MQPREAEELRSGPLCRQLDLVGVLLRKQDVLMLTFMVNLVALSPHSLKKHIPRRPCCSLELNRRSGATVPSRESELVHSKKNNEEVSDWYHASKYWLFATFASLFASPRASSRCLPLFASRLRLLSLRQRSFRTPGCRSGIDLDDLGAKKDYEEMLAKKWRLGTDEDALVVWLNVEANFPEQRRVGPSLAT